MNFARFATTHFKAVLFVTLVACLGGLYLAGTFPVSILPDVTFPRLVIIAEAGDMPARQVETGITRPIEEAVAGVPHVTRVLSKSQRGGAEISADFADGTDIVQSQNLVNAKIAEARGVMPAGTDVSVERMNPTVFPVLGLSLQSEKLSQSQLWELATYTLRPRLSRVPGVAKVVVQGGSAPEISVEVNPQRLAAYRLTLQDVSDALAQSNTVRAAGRFDAQFQQYQALVSGQAQGMAQLGEVVVAQRNGVPLHLRDVAQIRASEADRQTIVTAEGRESVLLNIVRQPDANSVSVAQGVQEALKTLRRELPKGARLSTFYDQTILINDAITSVRDAVLIGGVLAIVVLMLFLGDWRATLVTGAIIPATVLISFAFMRWVGLTLNLMTLGALAVGIGLVIDDAIVVVENVFRHLSHGESPADSVRAAAQEIAAPMISSTLTTVVVFLPLALLSGVAGAFFSALALTLTIALLVSLVLALFVSPSLCATFLKIRTGQREHGPVFDRLLRGYERLLGGALKHRWLLVPGIACIIGGTLFFGTKLETGFMPTMDEGSFILDYFTPPGTSLDESNRLLFRIEKILSKTPEVTSFSRRTGTEMGFFITEPNTGDFAVMLKNRPRRDIESVIDSIRAEVVEEVPGTDVEFVQILQDIIGDLSGAPSPMEVKLFGEDKAVLDETAKKIAVKIEKLPGFVDVQSGVVEAGPELVANVLPDRAGRVGLSASQIADQTQTALLGNVATQLLQTDRSIPVRVRLPQILRSDKAQLAALPIAAPGGFSVPLSSLARLESVPGTTELGRENQRRMVAVSAHLEGADLSSAVANVRGVMHDFSLPLGVTWELGGQYQSQQAAFNNLALVMLLAIVLVFAVMLFQFGSFRAPITILAVMPLALFGVAFGLWLTHTPLNVSSFMGAIMLVGVVVKNGILLLDQAQKNEAAGEEPTLAVLHAGRVRLRPILMTTLTAILGLVPLAMGLGAGAEMQKPLAIAVIGGLSFSTLFTLLFAPMVYVSLRRRSA